MINNIKKYLNEINNYYSLLINEEEFDDMKKRKDYSFIKNVSYHKASEALSYYNSLNKKKKDSLIKDFEEYVKDLKYSKSSELFKAYIINNYVYGNELF